MKKGISLVQLPQLFLVIMFAGVILGATYITLASLQLTQYADTTVVNETVTNVANNTYDTLANTPLKSVTNVTNTTATAYITEDNNYTIYNKDISQIYWKNINVTYLGNTSATETSLKVTYVYGKATKSSAGIGYIITFIDNISSNLPTVGIIVFIVTLIGVLMYLRTKRLTSGGA